MEATFENIMEAVLMNARIPLEDLASLACTNKSMNTQVDEFLPLFYKRETKRNSEMSGKVLSKVHSRRAYSKNCLQCTAPCDRYDPFTKLSLCDICCTPTISKTDSHTRYKMVDEDLRSLDRYEYKHPDYQNKCQRFRLKDVIRVALIKNRTKRVGDIGKSKARLQRTRLLEAYLEQFPKEQQKIFFHTNCVSVYLQNGVGGITRVKKSLQSWESFQKKLDAMDCFEKDFIPKSRSKTVSQSLILFENYLDNNFTFRGIEYIIRNEKLVFWRKNIIGSIIEDTFREYISVVALHSRMHMRDRYIATGSLDHMYEIYAQTVRQVELEKALNISGLSLCNSELCNNYICHGIGEIPSIVDTMAEMHFFYTFTNYAKYIVDMMHVERTKARQFVRSIGYVGNTTDYQVLVNEATNFSLVEKEAKAKALSEYSGDPKSIPMTLRKLESHHV